MKQLINLFRECRSAQKSFFRDRTDENLAAAKESESIVDKAIAEYDGSQTDMFSTGHVFTDADMIDFACFNEHPSRITIKVTENLKAWISKNKRDESKGE